MSMAVVGQPASNRTAAAQQGTIVLLPEDSIKPALCVITGVLAEVAVAVGPTALTVMYSGEFFPLFLILEVYATIGLVILVPILFSQLYNACYSEETLGKYRQMASFLDFGALVDQFGLERISQYNLLTPEERREKFTEWKKNFKTRNPSVRPDQLNYVDLLKFGFVTPKEFARVESYKKLNPSVPDNGYTGLAAREEFYQKIGWQIDPAPGREFRKKVAYLHVSKVFAGHDFQDMAFRQEVFTSTEYEALMRLKKMYEAAKGPGAVLAIHECNEEFHREFSVQ